MCRLICAFVVRIWHKTHFLMGWLKYFTNEERRQHKFRYFIMRVDRWCQCMRYSIRPVLYNENALSRTSRMSPKTEWFKHLSQYSFYHCSMSIIKQKRRGVFYPKSISQIGKNVMQKKHSLILMIFKNKFHSYSNCFASFMRLGKVVY